MRQHPATIEHALDQHFDFAARRFLAEQTRRNHPRVIENHQVAGAHVIEQLNETVVTKRTGRTVERQQTTGTTLGQWMSSDQRIREIEGKSGDLH